MPNAEQINQILNYSLLGVFIAIIVFFAIALIIGLFKGVFSTTFKLFFILMLVIISFTTLDLIFDAVRKIDLTSLNYYLNLINESTGEAISIRITTIEDTLANAIAGLMYLYNVSSGSSSEISAFAYGFAEMILKYAIVIVDMVLIATLGFFTAWILWHCCFKFLIPKLARKAVKIRWLAMLENGVAYVIVAALFLMPFTSLVNTINQSYQRYGKQSDDSVVSDIGSFIDTYNDSLLAKTFFNWTVDENGTTIDAQLLDSIISTTVGDVETSLIETISNISDIGASVMDAFSSSSNQIFDYGVLLSEGTLKNIFTHLNDTKLFVYLLPIVANLALNSNLLAQYVDTSLLEIDDINWSLELENIERMTLDVINSGVLDNFINENGEFVSNSDTTAIVTSLLDRNSYSYLTRIFESIDNSKLLSRAIPSVLWTVSETYSAINDILPLSWSEMNNYQWGKEFTIIYDCLFRMNQTDPEMVNLILNFDSNQTSQNQSILYQNNESSNNDLMDILIKNVDALKTILIGEFDQSGNLLNCDSNGVTIVYQNGRKLPNRHYSLFDSNIVKNIFPSLANSLIDLLPTSEDVSLDKDAVISVINNLYEGEIIKNFKIEFASILDSFSKIVSNDELLNIIKNPSSIDESFIHNQNTIKSFQEVLPSLDKSKIISAAVRPVLKNMLLNGEIAEQFKNVGIDPETFDLDMPNLGSEIAHLLDAVSCFDLIEDINNSNASSQDIVIKMANNYESIAVILDVVFESQIINPSDDFYGNYDNNFFNILNYIFEGPNGKTNLVKGLIFDEYKVGFYPESHGAGKHNWNNTKAPNGEYFKDGYGRPIFDGENGYIAQVIATLGTKSNDGQTLFEVVSSSDVVSQIGRLEKDFNISGLFKAVDNSSLFSTTFGSFLDETLSSNDLDLINVAEGRTFTQINDWTLEGIKFGRICDSIDQLGVDLNNLDITNIKNIPALNKLLHSLSDSGLFGVGDNQYNFNVFIYQKLQDNFADFNYDLTSDPFSYETGNPTYQKIMNDFDVYVEHGSSGDVFLSNTSKDIWVSEEWMNKFIDLDFSKPNAMDGVNLDEFYSSDTIGRVCRVLDEMNKGLEAANETEEQYGNIADAINAQAVPTSNLRKILLAMNDADQFRMVIYHLVDIIRDYDASKYGFDLNKINAEYMCDDGEFYNHVTTKEEREVEINYLVDILDIFNKLNIKDENGEFDTDTLTKDPNNMVRLLPAMEMMNESCLFHKGEFAIMHFDIDNQQVISYFDTTVFQDVIKEFVIDQSIGNFYYLADSPKDIYYDDIYVDVNSKAEHFIPIIFPNIGDENIFAKEKEEIIRIVELLSSLTGSYRNIEQVDLKINPDTGLEHAYYGDRLADENDLYQGIPSKSNPGTVTININDMDFDNIGSQSIQDILTNFNSSDLLYDCAPNALNTVFKNLDVGALTEAMQKADPFYLYYINSASNPNFEIRYVNVERADREDAYEIENIANVIENYKKLQRELNDAGIANFDEIFTITDDLVLDKVNGAIVDLLVSFKNTYTLHKGTAVMNGAYLVNQSTINRNLSAFETLIKSLYIRTGLMELAKLPASLSADSQLTAKIKLLTQQDVNFNAGINDVNYIGYSKQWNDEIEAFFDFVFDINKFITSGELDSFEFDLNSPNASPESISNILYRINKLDLAEGALPNLLKKTFTQFGLSQFSSYGNDENADKANYYLSQHEYGGDNNDGGEIDNIYNLLNEMQIKDDQSQFGGYVKIEGADGDAIKQFVEENGKSSKILTNFVYNSLLYNGAFELSSNINPGNITYVNSLFYYNIASKTGIEKYILGTQDASDSLSYNDSRIRTINKLLNDPTIPFNPDNEGESFDNLITHSDSFTGGFKNDDIDQVKSIKEAIVLILDSLTITEEDGSITRAYVASEMVAGILQPLLQIEVKNIATIDEPKMIYPRMDNQHQIIDNPSSSIDRGYLNKLYSQTYDLLNDYEAVALDAILDFYDPNASNVNDYLEKFNTLDDSFKKMVYTDVDGIEKNSIMASIIYCSRINPMIVSFNSSLPPFGQQYALPEADVNEFLDYGRSNENPGISIYAYYQSLVSKLNQI